MQTPAVFALLNAHDAGFLDGGSGALGSFEEHAIQVHARVDDQRVVERHFGFARVVGSDDGFDRLVDVNILTVPVEESAIH